MSETTKLTKEEIEEQLIRLKHLVDTEPAPPGVSGQIKTDTEICGLIAKMLLSAHQQGNYEHLDHSEGHIKNMEQDPSWSHPDLKRKVGHLRSMYNLVKDNPSSKGCMVLLFFGLFAVGGSYWLINLF